jgi:hypothetical protein
VIDQEVNTDLHLGQEAYFHQEFVEFTPGVTGSSGWRKNCYQLNIGSGAAAHRYQEEPCKCSERERGPGCPMVMGQPAASREARHTFLGI